MTITEAGRSANADVDAEPIVGPPCHDVLTFEGREVQAGCRGYGSTKSGIVFLGIAPGRDEVRTGRPLTGPSGKLLDAILYGAGIDRADVYCTNLICAWKDDPSPEEAARCAPRLLRELALVRPKIIVLLGGIVTETFLNRPMSKCRGAVQWNDQFGCYVMSTYHPAAILRGQGDRSGSSRDDKAATFIYDIVRDILKLKDVITWAPEAPEAQVNYEVVETPLEAQLVLERLPRESSGVPVAIDVETSSPSSEEIDVFKDRLLCVGVSTPTKAWVFTPDALFLNGDRDSPALDWPEDVHWTMQNALFDVQVMKRALDATIRVREDTMLQSYSLDERPGVHGLKKLAREYLAAGFWEEERKHGGKTDFASIPKDVLYKYNALDACYTARLCVKFRERQIRGNVREFYEQLLIPAVNTFKEVQLHGIKVDQKLLQQFAVTWGERYMTDEQELIDMAQEIGWIGDFNLNSALQMRKLLYEILALPGGPSTSQKNLEALVGAHPFIDKLMAFRHLAHMYDVYIIGILNQIKEDGKVHPVVKLHGTVTGRLAYTKPPMQTIPRPYKFGDTFGQLRKLFIPSSDEYVILEVDYGKAEIWTAQHYSQDPLMLEDLRSGDYHSIVAANTMHKAMGDVTPEDRRKAKLVTFGVLYGREARSLAEGIKVSVPEAQVYIDSFFRRYKDYSRFYHRTQNRAKEDGELTSAFGRKRRLIFIGSGVRTLKQSINYPIQSTTADCTLTSLIELHQRLKPHGGYVLFTVHDSIIFEIPKAEPQRSECVRIIHDVMTAQRFDDGPRMPIEMKLGKSWGDVKEIHDCDKEKCLA